MVLLKNFRNVCLFFPNVLTKSAGHARSKLEVEQKQWDVYWHMTKVSFISTENQNSLKLHTTQQIIYELRLLLNIYEYF